MSQEKERTEEDLEESTERYRKRAKRLLFCFSPDEAGEVAKDDQEDIAALNMFLCRALIDSGVVPNSHLIRTFNLALTVAFAVGRTNRVPLRTEDEAAERIAKELVKVFMEDIKGKEPEATPAVVTDEADAWQK
jgi:hypothetical protein